MRRTGVLAAALALITFTITMASPVLANFSVSIVAHTDFTAEVSDFDSDLPGCSDGTGVNGAGGSHFTPWGGVFVGTKVFTCSDGESGFAIHLTARFGGFGSTGRWTLSDAWGSLDGLKGSGSLQGVPAGDTFIDDIYSGILR
jgi:hypothetical protein